MNPLSPEKVRFVFVRGAMRALPVDEGESGIDSPESPGESTTLENQQEQPESITTRSKPGILHEYGPNGPRGGWPSPPKSLRLPTGLQQLRYGKSVYTPEFAEMFINAYYETGGSFTRACKKCLVKYTAAREWRAEYPEFARALEEVDEIIKDEIHSQFMTRVLNEWEPNPAWKFKYFNKNFPEYSETKKVMKVSYQIKDSLLKPDVIEGTVIPKQLDTSDGTGSEQAVDGSSNPAEVLPSDQ